MLSNPKEMLLFSPTQRIVHDIKREEICWHLTSLTRLTFLWWTEGKICFIDSKPNCRVLHTIGVHTNPHFQALIAFAIIIELNTAAEKLDTVLQQFRTPNCIARDACNLTKFSMQRNLSRCIVLCGAYSWASSILGVKWRGAKFTFLGSWGSISTTHCIPEKKTNS